MARFTEKQLDAFFHAKFMQSAAFAEWFLSQTKFCNRSSKLVLLRSDHPWYQSKKTGAQSETEILIVLEDISTAEKFAIHIENKLANGKFGAKQPELYHERANDWRHMAKFGNYDDYEAILIAPHTFFERHPEQTKLFHRYVSHEDIARFIPEFGGPDAV
jgi:hypothetical protein